jgi:hypothetical protein
MRFSAAMVQSRLSMFCPRCQAEYLPHVHRCSDCNLPLVERLPVTHGSSERKQVSGFILFKELGAFIVLPLMVLATLLVFVALGDNPFQAQIALIIGYTGAVFLLVFCDVGPGHAIKGKGTKGFSLGEKAVRQKLPLLVCTHAGSLLAVVAGLTGAMRLRPYTWSRWHLDTEYFDLILLLTCFAIAFAQVHFFRRLLERSLEDEQRSDRS